MAERIKNFFKKGKGLQEVPEGPIIDVKTQFKRNIHTKFTDDLKGAYGLALNEEVGEFFMNSMYISTYRSDGEKAVNTLKKDSLLMMKYLPAIVSSKYAMSGELGDLNKFVSKVAKTASGELHTSDRTVRMSENLLSKIQKDPSKYIEISQSHFVLKK